MTSASQSATWVGVLFAFTGLGRLLDDLCGHLRNIRSGRLLVVWHAFEKVQQHRCVEAVGLVALLQRLGKVVRRTGLRPRFFRGTPLSRWLNGPDTLRTREWGGEPLYGRGQSSCPSERTASPET